MRNQLDASKISFPPASGRRAGWPWTCEKAIECGRDARDWPRISLVTPSYNQAAFLEETIRSVLLQGYPNLQYIVIDGGSTDGSVEIIQKYSPWLDYWVSEPDRGQSHAINKALARCDGEWFNWLNSDDFLLPGALAALAAKIPPATPVRIVAGVTQNLRDAAVFGTYAARVSRTPPETFFGLGVNQPGSLLHRATVQSLGGVREDLRLTMDLDLWLRILLQHSPDAFAATGETVACYRYHENSKTCSAADVFALDEFALLNDLAAQCGAGIATPLAGLRQHSSIRAVPYPVDFAPDASAAERAWLDRLVVSDSLLFRALRRADEKASDIGRRFVRMLDELRPSLARHFDQRLLRAIEARALIRAQQALGRFDAAMTTRALTRYPTPSVVIEILRILARSARRP